jgi:hypothetical protein
MTAYQLSPPLLEPSRAGERTALGPPTGAVHPNAPQ